MAASQGSLWLGFGFVGPAGALTVAAETAAFHVLLDGVLIKRGAGSASSKAKAVESSNSSGNGAEGSSTAVAVPPERLEEVQGAPGSPALGAAGAADSAPVLADGLAAEAAVVTK